MSRKQANTPRSRIRSAIRQLWMKSRERAKVLKNSGYCCVQCGLKQSRAKGKEVSIQVHHVGGISIWEEVIDLIAKNILETEQVPLCKDCHKKEHEDA